MEISLLTQENATIIANDWKYPAPYDFYDATADLEDYEELLDPVLRQDHYYQVEAAGELIGFFACELDENVLDLGLGMRPDLTGRGQGAAFMKAIIDYLTAHFTFQKITLDVAEFNQRAYHLYRKLGFVEVTHFMMETNGGQYPFINLVRDFS